MLEELVAKVRHSYVHLSDGFEAHMTEVVSALNESHWVEPNVSATDYRRMVMSAAEKWLQDHDVPQAKIRDVLA